jgi:hypothetical protein
MPRTSIISGMTSAVHRQEGIYTPVKETLATFDAIYNGDADNFSE